MIGLWMFTGIVVLDCNHPEPDHCLFRKQFS